MEGLRGSVEQVWKKVLLFFLRVPDHSDLVEISMAVGLETKAPLKEPESDQNLFSRQTRRWEPQVFLHALPGTYCPEPGGKLAPQDRPKNISFCSRTRGSNFGVYKGNRLDI